MLPAAISPRRPPWGRPAAAAHVKAGVACGPPKAMHAPCNTCLSRQALRQLVLHHCPTHPPGPPPRPRHRPATPPPPSPRRRRPPCRHTRGRRACAARPRSAAHPALAPAPRRLLGGGRAAPRQRAKSAGADGVRSCSQRTERQPGTAAVSACSCNAGAWPATQRTHAHLPRGRRRLRRHHRPHAPWPAWRRAPPASPEGRPASPRPRCRGGRAGLRGAGSRGRCTYGRQAGGTAARPPPLPRAAQPDLPSPAKQRSGWRAGWRRTLVVRPLAARQPRLAQRVPAGRGRGRARRINAGGHVPAAAAHNRQPHRSAGIRAPPTHRASASSPLHAAAAAKSAAAAGAQRSADADAQRHLDAHPCLERLQAQPDGGQRDCMGSDGAGGRCWLAGRRTPTFRRRRQQLLPASSQEPRQHAPSQPPSPHPHRRGAAPAAQRGATAA